MRLQDFREVLRETGWEGLWWVIRVGVTCKILGHDWAKEEWSDYPDYPYIKNLARGCCRCETWERLDGKEWE